MSSYPRYGKSLSRKGPRMPKKRSRATPWYNRKYSPGDVAYKAWNMAKYLKGLINVEHQKVDTSIATTSGTTPAVVQLNAIAVGDAEGSRTGNSILQKYVYMKVTTKLNVSSNYSRLRLVLVQDKQQVGDTSPSYTDVYESASPMALINKLTVGRYSILYDRTFNLDANNAQLLQDKYIPINNHARYNGTASTDIQKNGLYLMYISDDNTNQPTISVNARLCYIDN